MEHFPPRVYIDRYERTINKKLGLPHKPGTEAWQALSTHEDMLKACQIPAEILKTVSTEELIELCLAYPLLGDIFAYNGIQEGISKVSARFNGLQELFKRKKYEINKETFAVVGKEDEKTRITESRSVDFHRNR